MTIPKAKTAEETARAIGSCWGDGLVAPKQCDEVYICELHGRFAQALESYADSVAEERVKLYAEKVNQQMRDAFEHWKELNIADSFRDGFKDGQERMRERAAKIANNRDHARYYEGKTIGEEIRSLELEDFGLGEARPAKPEVEQ